MTLWMKGSMRRRMVMPVNRLKEFLDENQIKYVTISHSPAYTAQTIAAAAHVPGKELAKTVMVKLDGKMAMVVLPASYRVDFELLKEASGAKRAEIGSPPHGPPASPMAYQAGDSPSKRQIILPLSFEQVPYQHR